LLPLGKWAEATRHEHHPHALGKDYKTPGKPPSPSNCAFLAIFNHGKLL
jgi:hypothetical protein